MPSIPCSPSPPTPGPRALWNEFSNLVWHVLKPETHKRNHRNETTVTTEAKRRRNERNHQNNRSKRMMHHILVLEMFCHSFRWFVIVFRWFSYFGLVVSAVTVVSFRWFRFDVSGFSQHATCMVSPYSHDTQNTVTK